MEIRIAKPNDKGNLNEIMYSSGTELYDFIFNTGGKNALDFIQHEFLSGKGFCGYNNVTVAIDNNQVVGTGCFYDGNEYNKLVFGTIKNVFSFYGPFTAWRVLAKMRHTSSVMRVPRKNEIYLSNFGVSSNLRGKGIGKKIMENKQQNAVNDGYKFLSLDVADNNPRAESLYYRLGFKVTRVKEFSNKSVAMPKTKEMKMAL